jgi:excisionase family DNA binding protein
MDEMARQALSIPTENKITLRLDEAQAVSGLSRSTLYELIKSGRLRAVKVAGRRLIPRDALEQLLLGDKR